MKLTKFETLHVQSLEAEKNYRVSKKLGEPADAMKHRSLREQASDIGIKVSASCKGGGELDHFVTLDFNFNYKI